MDKIFAEGRLWKHRTLRTIFDPPSTEWSYTSIEKKIEILKKISESGEKLSVLIRLYRERYIEQNRYDIANEVGNALAILMDFILNPSVAH